MWELDSADSWHYRRYLRWEQWKQRTNRRYEPRTVLDLCHYVKVVVIFYSLRWPFQRRYWSWFAPVMVIPFGLAALAVSAGIYGLTQVHDWLAVAEFAGLSIGLTVLIVGLIIGIIYAFTEKHLHTTIAQSESMKLGSAWVKAKKRRVCPLIQRPSSERP